MQTPSPPPGSPWDEPSTIFWTARSAALSQRLQQAQARGLPCQLVVRLQAENPEHLSDHLAAHWRWELLADEQGHVGLRPNVSIAVQLGEQQTAAPEMLGHGVLRVLFMAYSPENTEPELDYEDEEERILEALADFMEQGRAIVHVAEEGTLAELERRLKLEEYDVVHLSGHGMLRSGQPYLVMEDEEGQADPVSPDRLWAALRRARALPRMLMIASCHSAEARADMPSLAAQLVAWGVPSVVGWVSRVRDDIATLTARNLYERLCAGAASTEAVAFARRELFEADRGMRQPSLAWGTLHLVTRDAMGFQLDVKAPPAPAEMAPALGEVYRFLDEQGQMKVLARGFVGRRRELQRLVRIFRSGKDGGQSRAGAYILGMKGVGKSCLAGRAIDRHVQDVGDVGLVVLHGELMDHQVIEQFRLQAMQWRDDAALALLNQTEASVAQRLEPLLRAQWSRRRLVIVLDDFEQNLDLRPDGHARLRPHAAQLLEVMLPPCRVGRPKLLVTTTASFEAPTGEDEALAPIELGALQPGSITKLWLRGKTEEGDLQQMTLKTWRALAERLGRNARILDWARRLISGQTPAEVQRLVEEAREQLPDWREGGGDAAAQEQLARLFLHHMAFDEARRSVSPDSLTFVKRARVYETAVPTVAYRDIATGLDIDLDRHLPALANRGLLEVGRVGGERAYRVSPLVEPTLDVDNPKRLHRIAAAYWLEAWRIAGSLSFAMLQMGWEHALSADDAELAEPFARRIYVMLRDQGLYWQNRELALRHVSCFPDRVWSHLWAGDTSKYIGHLREGHAYFTQAEELAQQHGIDDASHSELLHAFSGLLQEQGDLSGARSRLEHALEIAATVYGTEEHPSVASSLHELARVLQDQGDLSGARSRLERVLEIDATVYGTEEHPDVATALHNLAQVLRDQGDLSGARSHLERALAIKARVYGTEEHLSVAASLKALASLLDDEGQPEAAVRTYQRVIEIQNAIYRTQKHYETAVTQISLAALLLKLNRAEEARPLWKHAIDVLQEQAPNHLVLQSLRDTSASPESTRVAAPPVTSKDWNALVRSVIMARRNGEQLTDADQATLQALSQAGSLNNQVAEFMQRLASQPIPPEVPADLPQEAADFLARVRELALREAPQP